MATLGVFAAIFDDDRNILAVRRAYPPFNWTLPGGRVEVGESPVLALIREVKEETSLTVDVDDLIGVYAAPFKDDLVLLFECSVTSVGAWEPDGEIAEVGYFAEADVPPDVSPRTAARVADAFAGRRGVIRVFEVGEP
jgi:ADP-ribose pyrophosphatase YjhB (NUDIX family)